MHCSGVAKDYKSAFLSYRLPLIKKLRQANRSFITVGPHIGCNRRLDLHLNTSESLFGGVDFAKSDSYFGRLLVEGVNDLLPALQKYRPDFLVFSLGTNDIVKGSGAAKMLVLYEKIFEAILTYRQQGKSKQILLLATTKIEKNVASLDDPSVGMLKTLFLSTIPLDVNRPKSVRKFRKANQRLLEVNDAVHERFFAKTEMNLEDASAGAAVATAGAEASRSTMKLFPLALDSLTTWSTKNENNKNNNNEKQPQRSSEIYLLRVHEGFDPRTMTYDAIHPNKKGEQFLAEKIFPALSYLMAMTNLAPRGNKRKEEVEATRERDTIQSKRSQQQQQFGVVSTLSQEQRSGASVSHLDSASFRITMLAAIVCFLVVVVVIRRSFFGKSK